MSDKASQPLSGATRSRVRRRWRQAATDRRVRDRNGFTLVELLVVIAIIGVLISLLLPAVQASREAARRVQCATNAKQLALAVQSYESARKVLPPAGVYDDQPWPSEVDLRSGKMLSWVVFILPYMEQASLFARFDVQRSVLDQPGDPQAESIPLMYCPSDNALGKFFADSSLTSGKKFAKGNYAAYCSPFHTDLQQFFPGALVLGGLRGGQKVSKVIDGLSRTLLLSEVRVRDNQRDQRGAWALPWTGASLLAFDMHSTSWGSPLYKFEASPFSLGLTQRPNNRGPNVDMLYACPDIDQAQMQGMPCEEWAPDFSEWHFLSAAPRSRHPGGVNVAFLDGHVGFLLNEVDEIAMAYMVSINDSQPIAISDYVR